jgi:uncharacterized protein (TIGR02147 family)
MIVSRNSGYCASGRDMKARQVSTEQAGIYSKWFYMPIRDLLSTMPVTDNFHEVGNRLNPAITADEVREAIEVLENHGLVERDELSGCYRAADRQVSTGTCYPPSLVRTYLKEGIDLGKRAVDAFPADERQISTVTFSVDSDKYDEILGVLAKARKDILQISRDSFSCDEVYQLNIQFFPVAQRRKANDKADADCR